MWHCWGRMWWHLAVTLDVALEESGCTWQCPGVWHLWRRDMVALGSAPGCGTSGEWWHLAAPKDVTLDVALLEKGHGGTWQCPRMWHF